MRVLLATLAAAVATVLTPATADAAPAADPVVQAGPFKISSVANGMCLDTNGFDVYTHPCTANNEYQMWHIWNTEWTASWRFPDRCLTVIGTLIRLELCSRNPVKRAQFWQYWHGGWYKNHYTNRCLQAYPGNGAVAVRGHTCIDNVWQFWYVYYA